MVLISTIYLIIDLLYNYELFRAVEKPYAITMTARGRRSV